MGTFVFGIAASLYVGLCAVANQVMLLAVFQVFVESLIIFCASCLVAVIGDNGNGIQCVGSHASLHAAPYVVADQTGHQLLFQQVVLGMVDMGAAVDFLSRQMGGGHTDILIRRVICNVIALLHHPESSFIPRPHPVYAFAV